MATPWFPVVSDVVAKYDLAIPAVFNCPELLQIGDQILRFMNPDITESPTKNWPLARFDHVVSILGLYLLWVLLAPSIVKLLQPSKRVEKSDGKKSVVEKFSAEPLVLSAMCVYNLSQVALCAYMMYGAYTEAVAKQYTFICNAFNPKETGMALVLWVFYTSKILDFFDTVFMVLRGKWRQLSFLHVYHHVSIFLFYWINVNVGYDGDIYYTIIVNSFIHFVMYGYYFFTTLNVPVPKPIKMLVTNMQLIQFVTMMSQAGYILLNGCPYPRIITIGYLVYIFSLYLLFSDFKRTTYKAGDKKPAAATPAAPADKKKAH